MVHFRHSFALVSVAAGKALPHNKDMATKLSEIFEAALRLPDAERARLANRLLQTLKPPGIVNGDDVEFEADLEWRVADYDSGKTEASDWIEVATRLRKALQQRPSQRGRVSSQETSLVASQLAQDFTTVRIY